MVRNLKTTFVLARLVEATSPSVVSAYEKRIERLERDDIVLAERVENYIPPKGRLEEFIELQKPPFHSRC